MIQFIKTRFLYRGSFDNMHEAKDKIVRCNTISNISLPMSFIPDCLLPNIFKNSEECALNLVSFLIMYIIVVDIRLDFILILFMKFCYLIGFQNGNRETFSWKLEYNNQNIHTTVLVISSRYQYQFILQQYYKLSNLKQKYMNGDNIL